MPAFDYIDLSSLNAIIPDKHWDDFMQQVDGDIAYGSPDSEVLIKGSKIVSILDGMDIPEEELEAMQAKLKEVLYREDLYVRID